MGNIFEPKLNKTSKRAKVQLENLEARIAPCSIAGPGSFDTLKGHTNPQGNNVGGGKGGQIVLCYGY